MQESGGALLRAIQNDSMNPLDLLVRESVQNSLDAALSSAGRVYVDFSVRAHTTEAILYCLKGGVNIQAMKLRFPTGGRLLEIRDSYTEGLSGPLDLQDVGLGQSHGNLLKLVYEVGRSRHDETAGGSWGLGKTCYFRMGIGLVIYYSRVLQAGALQERLVACLVENEEAVDRLQTSTRTGIAWWGKQNELQPITDPAHISSALASLGISPFKGVETGTSIMIPFLRDDLIPDAGDESDSDEDVVDAAIARPWWFAKYEDYLTIALQRWFCARLDNPKFRDGPMLAASVNGKLIRASSMMPTFQIVQALYNRLGPSSGPYDDFITKAEIAPADVLTASINLRTTFANGSAAGKVMAVLLTKEELRMAPPDNYSDPFLHIFGHTETSPPYRPLVTFMRRPGMLVRWDDSRESRGWGGGLAGAGDGRFLIALFLPEKDRRLNVAACLKLRNSSATLESYLRGCEKADHHHWNDQAGFAVIAKIRTQVGKHLKEFGVGQISKATSTPALRTARNLADRLLPRGFGTDGRHGSATDRGRKQKDPARVERMSRSSEPSLEIVKIAHEPDGIRLEWTLQWGVGSEPRDIILSVDSEAGQISPESWYAEGLGNFPFLISSGSTNAFGLPTSPAYDVRSTVLDSTVFRLVPGTSPVDRSQIEGELKIQFRDEIGSSLLPVLRLTIAPAEMGQA
ncbi:MAG: hypothetical protein JWQ01_4732 [Massilia sp.]|nr:hypothetical protein [Massilia sp.]